MISWSLFRRRVLLNKQDKYIQSTILYDLKSKDLAAKSESMIHNLANHFHISEHCRVVTKQSNKEEKIMSRLSEEAIKSSCKPKERVFKFDMRKN